MTAKNFSTRVIFFNAFPFFSAHLFLVAEALLEMVALGSGLCSVPFFGLKIGENQKNSKKGLRRKISGFLVQIKLETKPNEKEHGLLHQSVELCFHIIYIIMWRHSKIVSTQNGVNRGSPPQRPLATPFSNRPNKESMVGVK